jgi:hypothetical protein
MRMVIEHPRIKLRGCFALNGRLRSPAEYFIRVDLLAMQIQ